MNKLHILVSIINLGALFSFIAGYAMHLPYALFYGEMVGITANVSALVIGLIVLVIIVVRVPSGEATKMFHNSWLGLVNAAAVIIVWSVAVLSGVLGS